MSIYYQPSDVLECFYTEVLNATESRILAEDKENGIVVSMYDDGGYPKIIVMCDDLPIDEATLDDPIEAAYQMEELYKEYTEGEGAPESKMTQQEAIDYREQELLDAMTDMLGVVLEMNTSQTEKFYEGEIPGILDDFLEYLYKKRGTDLHRPMILVDDNDEEFFEEYPYSCMEFD